MPSGQPQTRCECGCDPGHRQTTARHQNGRTQPQCLPVCIGPKHSGFRVAFGNCRGKLRIHRQRQLVRASVLRLGGAAHDQIALPDKRHAQPIGKFCNGYRSVHLTRASENLLGLDISIPNPFEKQRAPEGALFRL